MKCLHFHNNMGMLDNETKLDCIQYVSLAHHIQLHASYSLTQELNHRVAWPTKRLSVP